MLSITGHRDCTFLHLLCAVRFFPLFASLAEKKQSCEDREGALVAISLAKDLQSMLIDSQFSTDWDLDIEGQQIVCIPENCAVIEVLHTDWCANIRGWLLRSLWDTIPATSPDDGRVRRGGFEGFAASELAKHDWMIHGVSSSVVSHVSPRLPDRPPSIATQLHRSEGTQFRVAVVSHHAPLASLMVAHLRQAFLLSNQQSEFVLALYSTCYLCPEIAGCAEAHVPSKADRLCELFHSPDEANFERFYDIAQDIAPRELDASVVMCFGLAICHFIFSLLSPTVARLQLLCMNPLQGVPENIAGMMLLDIDRRLQAGEIILTTNAVTSSLLSYHIGRKSESVTLFRSDLFAWGVQSHWEPQGKDILLASSFLLQVSGIYWLLRTALEDSLPDFSVTEHKHDKSWTLSSQSHVASMLQYVCAVYIPEHPYKNYFNDLYAMRLPIFLPTLDFLTNLLPEVASLERAEPYEGWFDRRIPKTRLVSATSSDLPEPFDMRTDGKIKVSSWFQFADYFRFPGVLYFVGVADLAKQLYSSDLPSRLSDTREAMAQHFDDRRAAAADQFLRLVEQILK